MGFPIDKTGRKLKVGQIVDIHLLGTFQAKVIGIKGEALVLSKSQQFPPHLSLAINVTPRILPNDICPEVYIIAEADPKDPLVVADSGKDSKIIM